MAGTYTCLLYHFVFSTKSRQPFITPDITPRLYAFLGGCVREQNGILYEIGGMPDHVHMYVRMKTEPSITDLMESIKGGSSRWVHQEFGKEHRRFAWQEGYGAFTVSKSQEARLKSYIRNQARHHKTKDFKTEFIEFLERHGVEYDERYIFR